VTSSKKRTAPAKASRIEPIPPALIDAINENRCVVFVGAGLSVGAGYPNWLDLLKSLIKRGTDQRMISASREKELTVLVETKDTVKLLMVAEELRDLLGADDFESALADTFQDGSKQPTEVHNELPEIPFSAAITTNYDKLLEYAYAASDNGRSPPVFTSNDAADLANALFKQKFFIMKAHGDVEKRSTMVITEKDYRKLSYRSGGYKTVLSALFTTRSVLFLGSSLADPETWLLLGFLHDCFHGSGAYHYALLPKGETADVMFNRWRKDFQVHCIHYEPSSGHPEVLDFLRSLPHK
jgi:hypothetical protein